MALNSIIQRRFDHPFKGGHFGSRIVRDISNQMSRGFGFVEMVRKVDAKKALKTLNDFELKGKRMAVNEAKQERDRNSAGGGKNFGGRRR